MKYANKENLINCNKCKALYDKTLRWVKGYYEGTSNEFHATRSVKVCSCPICGEKND